VRFLFTTGSRKSAKISLYSKGRKPFGHSLVGFLSEAVREGFPEPSNAVRDAATGLDKHYTSSRYPDAFESQIPDEAYTVEIAEEALEWAQLLMQYGGAKPA